MTASAALHVLTLQAPVADADLLADLLAGAEYQAATWEARAEALARINLYFPSRAEAEAAVVALPAHLAAWAELLSEPVRFDPEIRLLPREDWANSWKRFFHPRRVSSRLVVKPSWEPFAAGPDDVVLEIDPGMCFGTGQHATTASCLQMLDELAAPGGSFLDIGCGSGILAIAAWKLGYRPVAAFDYDPDAVTGCRENLERNGISPCEFEPFQADLEVWRPAQPCRVVAANILAGPLVQFAPTVVSCLEPGAAARLILSGILASQYAEVRERYCALGWRELRRLDVEDWSSGLFGRA